MNKDNYLYKKKTIGGRNNFSISREDLNKHIEKFLKDGGVIEKVETEDSYYSINPVGTDIFSKSKGSILDHIIGG